MRVFDELTFTLAAHGLFAALREGSALAATVTNRSSLGDALFVLNSRKGFFGHPREDWGVPQNSTPFGALVNRHFLTLSLYYLLHMQNVQ